MCLKELDLLKEDSYLPDINKTYYNKGNSVKYSLERPKTRTAKRVIVLDENAASILEGLIKNELCRFKPNNK